MNHILMRLYDRWFLRHPIVVLLVTMAVIGFFAAKIPLFRLDASGESLLLENDAALHYQRQLSARYSTQEVLVLTYSPKGDLFDPESLADLKALRDELRQVKGVSSVSTMLDVPLIYSTDISLSEVGDEKNIKTLEKSGVDRATVLRELQENPLYRGRLMSQDAKTTAILVNLEEQDPAFRTLQNKRYALLNKKFTQHLSAAAADELAEIDQQYRERLTFIQHNEKRLVEAIRAVRDRHQTQAQLFLGGVPMIIADMIAFIKSDLVVFGVGVLIFLVITLAVIFGQLRWICTSLLCCGMAVVTMLGYLGMMDWPVTIISSNFISLMLILTMSLTIHLTERYLEVQTQTPDADQRELVKETVRSITRPCLYTSLTTMVAFISLLVSDIRPVMDFGKMMSIGLFVATILAFIIFPTTLMLLKKGTPRPAKEDKNPFTLHFARFTRDHGNKVLLLCLLLVVASGLGIKQLKVDNRFIDYFREKTEIYQGMSLIDRKLGGTTPLDLLIDFKVEEEKPLADEFAEEDALFAEEDAADHQPPPWYADVYRMERIEAIHDYLGGLSEIGEVLSLATLGKITTRLNDDVPLANFELALLYKKIPADIRELLVKPYVADIPTQARFTMRIVESDKDLQREALLGRIRKHLTGQLGLAPEQVTFSNMYVLYNNMLQSLFHSQIMTIGMVFLAIMAMFLVLFRSLSLAVVTIIPNILPVAMVLGVLGWLRIPLDMMTITIASITIGISVDDAIHYVHRFKREFAKDGDYLATMFRCHHSVGRAMFYTSVTITIGFSILVLSNFIPTIYFGLFTGFAMVVAMLANLTLLPKLLTLFKPLGPGISKQPTESA